MRKLKTLFPIVKANYIVIRDVTLCISAHSPSLSYRMQCLSHSTATVLLLYLLFASTPPALSFHLSGIGSSTHQKLQSNAAFFVRLFGDNLARNGYFFTATDHCEVYRHPHLLEQPFIHVFFTNCNAILRDCSLHWWSNAVDLRNEDVQCIRRKSSSCLTKWLHKNLQEKWMWTAGLECGCRKGEGSSRWGGRWCHW